MCDRFCIVSISERPEILDGSAKSQVKMKDAVEGYERVKGPFVSFKLADDDTSQDGMLILFQCFGIRYHKPLYCASLPPHLRHHATQHHSGFFVVSLGFKKQH